MNQDPNILVSNKKAFHKNPLVVVISCLFIIMFCTITLVCSCSEKPRRKSDITHPFGMYYSISYLVWVEPDSNDDLKDFTIYTPFPAANGGARKRLLTTVLNPDPLKKYRVEMHGYASRRIVATTRGDMLQLKAPSFKGVMIESVSEFYTLLPINCVSKYPLIPSEEDATWIYLNYEGEGPVRIYLQYSLGWILNYTTWIPTHQPTTGYVTTYIVGTAPAEVPVDVHMIVVRKKGWVKLPLQKSTVRY